MDPATATAASVHARRRSSISDYSSLFSNGQPKASSFVGKTRHPSLTMSMKGERPAGFSALQRAMSSATSQGDNEQAIVDDELSQSTGSIGNAAAGGAAASVDGNTAQHKRSLTDDPVGLARRLSQGARAIMYNGNRLKGDGVAPLKRAPSTGSVSPSMVSEAFDEPHITPSSTAAAGKQIRRKMSPTGERMLRGELQM